MRPRLDHAILSLERKKVAWYKCATRAPRAHWPPFGSEVEGSCPTAWCRSGGVAAVIFGQGRIDLANTLEDSRSDMRVSEKSRVGGTDTTTAITQLQEAMTVLEASQASFTKLSSLSLFDFLK